MTAAQKKVAANFKKALAYRKQTGCSLKEAFAKVYGKKTTATKKAAPKKSAPKKKTIGATKVSTNLGQRLYDQSSNAGSFTDEASELIGTARDMGYSFAQTKVAIKYILDGVYNFYEDEF
jgi:hypothetical protein